MYATMNREPNTENGEMPEMNADVIARIRNLVSYDVSTARIVELIPTSVRVTERWVAFVAEMIRTGRI